MTIADWLAAAIEDARRRGLPELQPLLETLAKSTAALRTADPRGSIPRTDVDSRGTPGMPRTETDSREQ